MWSPDTPEPLCGRVEGQVTETSSVTDAEEEANEKNAVGMPEAVKRLSVLAGSVVVGALVLVASVPALAQGVIYNGLDGPGPFAAVQIPFDRLICLVQEEHNATQRRTGTALRGETDAADFECSTDVIPQPSMIRAHLSAELTFAYSGPFTETNSDYPDIGLVSFKPIVFYRLHNSLDVGVGLAANRFFGTDFAEEPFQFWRVSLPFRTRITWPWSRSRWRAVYLSLGADYFPGVMTGEDFRAKPGTSAATFRAAHVVMKSWHIGVDVIKVITGCFSPC
jgi:hypothetical protein